MKVYTITKGFRVAFGHFNNEEITQMQSKGWKVEYGVKLKPYLPTMKKKQVGVNKHGIPIMQ